VQLLYGCVSSSNLPLSNGRGFTQRATGARPGRIDLAEPGRWEDEDESMAHQGGAPQPQPQPRPRPAAAGVDWQRP